MKQKKIAVIGGGLGGLSAACRLQRLGAQVTLFEKNSVLGGKAAEWRHEGYRWDMGPSLLTMPEILRELFEFCGERLEDYLTLQRIAPVCRYFWQDGSQLDEDKAFFSRPDVKRFLDYAGGIYSLSGKAFLQYPPEKFWKAFSWRNLPALRHLPKIATFSSMQTPIDRFFKDPHLRQLFGRFATYNGSSPWKAPAAFNVIPYMEAALGAWYVEGGMARLPEALGKIAQKLGVEICLNAEVSQLDEAGLLLESGSRQKFDFYVVNADVIEAHRRWIRFRDWEKQEAKMVRRERSLSGLVVMLGVNKRFEKLSHHNIFFSKDYRNEFEDIFQRRRLPEDPTIYVSITSHTNEQDAPPGCDNYFILINSPAEVEAINWESRRESLGPWIIQQLEARGLPGLGEAVKAWRVWTPLDFAKRDASCHGALYGWASHTIKTALLRPPLRSPLNRSTYFVGGTTHPGGGVPLVLLSARMVEEKISETT